MSCENNDCRSSSCKECNEASTTPCTPFVTAASSPKKSTLCTTNDAVSACRPPESTNPSDFDFSVRISKSGLSLIYPGSLNPACSTMSTAEELFQNGQIKPLNARFSACICCNHAVQCGGSYDVSGHTYDPSCPQCAACKGSSLSRNKEHQHTSRRHGRVKLPLSDSALGQWRKTVDRNNVDEGGASLHAHAHPRVGRVTQIPSLPLASYGKSGAGRRHRRARSLSPLRVFHMDDMIQSPRPSFESELYTHMSSVHTESNFSVAITRPRRRRGRKSWTLKELLNLGDNKVHDKRPQVGSKGSHDPAKVERKADSLDTHMEKAASEIYVEDKGTTASADGNVHSKSSMHLLNEGGILSCSPWNLQRALKRAEHEAVCAEEPRKRTVLPDKEGLLGCLQGFTSKISSVKSFHGTSQFKAR